VTVSLAMGSAPFGQMPGGRFNDAVTVHGRALYFERSPRRVRGMLGGETVVDSRRVMLLHETGHLPVWYFPAEDVRQELLEPTDRSTHCPLKGDARYWTVRGGGHAAENAVWSYPEPIAGAPDISGYLAFYFGRLDAWYEEDEQVFVHPRDPYHRVDAMPTSRHVRVSLDGQLLAESDRATALFETGLQPRWYLPPGDVTATLEPSDVTSRCPYKGQARYWSVRVGDRVENVLVWAYDEPLPAVAPITRLQCFFDERCDVEIDGEVQPRLATPWATDGWARRRREAA
jgi:uncharacterized protein (DUF427 family)